VLGENRDVAAPATLDDVVGCYCLLLGRSPDEGGLGHYRSRLEAGTLSVAQLVDEFLGSAEFARAYAARHGQGASTQVVETVEGFRLHLDPLDHAIGYSLSLSGSYEPEVTATVKALLRPGSTFVDVGANIGWYSLLAAGLVGPTGRVVAVEPNPANVALLEAGAKDNGLTNITALTMAVADAPGVLALETDGSNGRIIPVPGPPAQPVRASYVVAAQSLDSVLAQCQVSRVHLVKLDVEGAEPLVLKGAQQVLARDQPVLVSEFYPLALDLAPWGGAVEFLAMLRELGYRLSVIGPGTAQAVHRGQEAVPGQSDEVILEAAGQGGRDHVDLLALPGEGAHPTR
jgi:FkbM family methyltransferase